MENKESKNIETKEEKTRRTNRDLFSALELVSKLGISIAIIAGSFVYAGLSLDRRFGTGHAFLLVFMALSIVVSIYDIYWLLEPIVGSDKRKNFLKRKKKG
jgi:F0F1-type ATP synthase assembly protein I